MTLISSFQSTPSRTETWLLQMNGVLFGQAEDVILSSGSDTFVRSALNQSTSCDIPITDAYEPIRTRSQKCFF